MGRPAGGILRSRAALAAFLAAAAAVGWWIAHRGPSGPDVVLVVWDTCRGDRVSVNGYRLPTTPRLEALAAEGTNFPHCFTPSPWTPPAHASLFTGLIPSRHGLRESYGDRVHPGIPLLAATLAKAGYETVAAPANPLLGVSGLLEGFEKVLPMTEGAEKDSGDAVAARVEDFLRKRAAAGGRRRPLFLFVNLMDAHLPLAPSKEDLAAVHGAAAAAIPADGADVTPFAALDHVLGLRTVPPERIRTLALVYDGGVHAADRATGRILDGLRGAGIYDGAFVAVTGDHGECLGEHGELEHRMSIREPVLHVPLVVRWPGRFLPGGTEKAQVRLQDLYRTILDAAAVAAPPTTGKDSRSLGETRVDPRDAVAQLQAMTTILPRIKERFPELPPYTVERFRSAYLVFRLAATGPSPRKLVLATTDGAEGAAATDRAELYDLAADPGEEADLLLRPGPGSPAAGEVEGLRAKTAEAVR